MKGRAAVGCAAVTALLSVALVMATSPAAAAMIELPADRDNTLFQDATGSLSNGTGPAVFCGRNSQGLIRRALVRFEVASSVPPGAVVTSAMLKLHLSNVSDSAARVVTLHRVTRDWGEGTSWGSGGGGAAVTTGDATWLHASWPGVAWSSEGGDFAVATSASQLVGDVGEYVWSASTMIADVQAWLDDPATNLGWLVVGDESVANTARRFDSRESEVSGQRPTLEITYAFPVAVSPSVVADAAFLAPCRPNPGIGPMTFAFSIPRTGHVELIVVDVGGRRVATLADGLMSAGDHQMVWTGRGAHGGWIPSGAYFYRLSFDSETVATHRCVILR